MAEVKHSPRPLRRGRQRIIGGVCSGIAANLDLDPTLVRIAFVLLALANGIGIIAYVVLWFVMPDEGPETPWTVGSAAGSVGHDVARMGTELKSAVGGSPKPPPPAATAWTPPGSVSQEPAGQASQPSPGPVAAQPAPARGRTLWPGVVLIVIGLALLAGNFGWLWWTWSIGFPVVMVAAGIWLLTRRRA